MTQQISVHTVVKKTSLLLFAIAVFSAMHSSVLAGLATAASTETEQKAERSYMQFFSEKGTYSRVRITLTGSLDNAHSCGRPLNSGNDYSFTKKLSKSGTTRINCDAVSGAQQYSVAFYKGSRTALGQEVIVKNGVNVNSSNCTVIQPRGSVAISSLKNKCPSAAGVESIARRDVAMQVCLSTTGCQTTATGVNPRKGISGRVHVLESAANDGSPHVSKVFCSGHITYQYQNSTTGALSAVYKSVLRFKSDGTTPDRCEAAIKTQNLRLAPNTNYTLLTGYSVGTGSNVGDQRRPNIYLKDVTGATTSGAIRTK